MTIQQSKWTIAGAVATLALAGAAAAWYWTHQRSTPEAAPSGLNGDKNTGANPAKGKNPPVVVTWVQAQQAPVDIRIKANGQVSAINTVDIHAQVTSTISRVHIKEGQFVKAGQVLFTLDDRADQANVAKLKAQLIKDQATLADLQRQLLRSQDLANKQFVSPSAVDNLKAQVDGQQAAIKASEAAIQAGQVSLSYQTIRAPLSGRAGIINVYPGTLVQPTSSLVTVTQLDPINVSFAIPERYLQSLLQKSNAKVMALLDPIGDQSLAPLEGTLLFVDNVVDVQTGTVKAKAQFANSTQKLWPGQYVNLDVPVQHLEKAITVPSEAIITSPTKPLVYVVSDNMTAQAKPIKVLAELGERTVVSGIDAGDKVVVSGKQNVKPGSPLKEARP